jgi:hypothetical protein
MVVVRNDQQMLRHGWIDAIWRTIEKQGRRL